MISKLIEVILSGHGSESYYEEIANCTTHLLGIALSVVGVYFLATISAFKRGWHYRVGSLVYGVSLIIMYVFSTIYHSVALLEIDPVLLIKLRRLDYIAIYALIAGTYTPMILVGCMKHQKRPKLGAFGLTCIWSCAISGITAQILYEPHEIPLMFSIGTYLFMGWFGVLGVPFIRQLPPLVVRWLAAGGLTYSLGVLFLVWDSLHFNHSIWHLFTLSASAFHYVTVVLLMVVDLEDYQNHSAYEVLSDLYHGKQKQK